MSECGYKFTTLNGICGLTEGHDGPHQTEAEAKALAQDVAVELQARITELEALLEHQQLRWSEDVARFTARDERLRGFAEWCVALAQFESTTLKPVIDKARAALTDQSEGG